jgi:hypothetical protein
MRWRHFFGFVLTVRRLWWCRALASVRPSVYTNGLLLRRAAKAGGSWGGAA